MTARDVRSDGTKRVLLEHFDSHFPDLESDGYLSVYSCLATSGELHALSVCIEVTSGDRDALPLVALSPLPVPGLLILE